MNRRKRILVLTLFLLFLSSLSRDIRPEPFYEVLDIDSEAFARFSRGLVYIGKQEFLDTLIPSENDVLVLDARDEKDPDMKVFSSYKIEDSIEIEEIVKILLEYERMDNTDWKRSERSMITEWRFHNFLYRFYYEQRRTTDVDFNNADEDNYTLKHILGI